MSETLHDVLHAFYEVFHRLQLCFLRADAYAACIYARIKAHFSQQRLSNAVISRTARRALVAARGPRRADQPPHPGSERVLRADTGVLARQFFCCLRFSFCMLMRMQRACMPALKAHPNGGF